MTTHNLYVSNGIVNLYNCSFRPYTKGSKIQYRIPVAWEKTGPNTDTSYIDSYICDLMGNNESHAKFLKKMIGSLFVDHNKIITFYGKGNDGSKLLKGILELYKCEDINIQIIDNKPDIDDSIIVPFNNVYLYKIPNDMMGHSNIKLKNPFIVDELFDHVKELLVWIACGARDYIMEGLNDVPPEFINNIHNRKTDINIDKNLEYCENNHLFNKIYHVSGERVAVPESIFKNRLDNDLGGLFKNFDWDGVVLAGEYVLGCLDKIALYKEYFNTSIDIYVCKPNLGELHHKISLILSYFNSKFDDLEYILINDTYNIEIIIPEFSRKINVIGVIYDSIEEVVNNINYSCYQVGYNENKGLIYSDKFIDSMISRVAYPEIETPDVMNIYKILNRGFAFEKIDRFVNCNLLYHFDPNSGNFNTLYYSGFTKVNKDNIINDICNGKYSFVCYDSKLITDINFTNNKNIDNMVYFDKSILEELCKSFITKFDNYRELISYLNFDADIKEDYLTLRN